MSRKKRSSPSYPEFGEKAETPHSNGGNLPTLPISPPLGGGLLGEVSWGVSPTPISPVGELGRKLGRKSKKKPLTIIEDTREQTPLTDWPEGVAVEVGTHSAMKVIEVFIYPFSSGTEFFVLIVTEVARINAISVI